MQESQDDSAAATASAIVIASAEAGAQEIALVRAQQKDEIEALGVQFQDQILEAKHERKNEIEALKRRNQAQRSDLENSLQELSELREAREGLKQEKQEKQEQEAEDTEERIRILVEKGTLLSEKHEEQAMELQVSLEVWRGFGGGSHRDMDCYISLYCSYLSQCRMVHWKASPHLLLSHPVTSLASHKTTILIYPLLNL